MVAELCATAPLDTPVMLGAVVSNNSASRLMRETDAVALLSAEPLLEILTAALVNMRSRTLICDRSMAPGFGRSIASDPEVFIPSPSLLAPSTETESALNTLVVQVEPLSSEYSIR